MGTQTRRPRGAARPPSAQQTLSFKNESAKVTKPSATRHSEAKTKSKPRLSDPAKEEIIESISTPDPDPVTVEAEAEPVAAPTPRKKKRVSGASSAVDPREVEAEKITDNQIRKWWDQEQKHRGVPAIHQEAVPLHEKILRNFDLSGQYGSCIGITRLNRWRRANSLGLSPPLEVMAVLLREAEGSGAEAQTSKAKGKGAKGAKASRAQGCGAWAYIDELAGGRVGVVDA